MPDLRAGTAGPPTEVSEALLRSWPLPVLTEDSDKEARGHVLIVAGSREMPGAALLASEAALRSGAGKLTVATSACVAAGLALVLPEARVLSLPETADGGLDAAGVTLLLPLLERAHALLIGPGLVDDASGCRFVAGLLSACTRLPVLLDALAMNIVLHGRRFEQPVLMTPHAGEMAHLLGIDKDAVRDDPQSIVRDAAQRWNALVALKGAVTWIAAPDGALWRHEGGSAGLGTSGSGDTLAGIIVGLLARGASPEQAIVWGVAVHARAGERLARRLGALGFLAREIPAEVPALLDALA